MITRVTEAVYRQDRAVTQIFVLKNSRPNWDAELYRRARQEGAAEGACGRPAADAVTVDGVEAKLHSEVRERALAVNGVLSNELNRINPVLAAHRAELAQNQHLFETRHDPEVSGQTFENMLRSRRAELAEAYHRKHSAEGHYNLFRFQHSIAHSPDHPGDRLNYLSWIFLILAFETLLNSLFWTGSMGGFLTTALLISFLLSAINIGIGFASGALFSYKNLSTTPHIVLGWSSLVAGIGLSSVVNYYIITHRSTEAFSDGTGDGVNKTLSLAMFVLGMGFALFAMYKGSRFFGSVPGYEAASRQYLEAERDVAAIVAKARDEIHAERRAQEDLRRRLVATCGELKVKAVRLIADIDDIRTQYLLALDRLDDILRQCVKTYRDANRAVRASRSSSPGYFGEPIESIERHCETLVAAEQAIVAHCTEIDAQVRQMQEVAAAETGRLREVAAQYLGQGITEWAEAADREGMRRHEDSIRAVECDARRTA